MHIYCGFQPTNRFISKLLGYHQCVQLFLLDVAISCGIYNQFFSPRHLITQ
jgi:hypothetical protein